MIDRSNYDGKDVYIESKQRYTDCVSKYGLECFDATYCIAESGTTGPNFYVPGIKTPFSSISVTGPNGTRSLVVNCRPSSSREECMQAFTVAAIELLHSYLIEDSKL